MLNLVLPACSQNFKFPAPCARLNRPALDSLVLKFWYCVCETPISSVFTSTLFSIFFFFFFAKLQTSRFWSDTVLNFHMISFLGSNLSISEFRVAFLFAYSSFLSFGVTCYLSGPESANQKKEVPYPVHLNDMLYISYTWCLIVCYPITRGWIVFINVMMLELRCHD